MKTQGSIWIDKKAGLPTELQEFLKAIFYKRNKIELLEGSELILRETINRGLIDKDRNKIRDSLPNLTEKQYYSILSRLKTLGLIKKKFGVYYTDKTFCRRLNNLGDYWEAIHSKSIKPKELDKPFARVRGEITESTSLLEADEPD